MNPGSSLQNTAPPSDKARFVRQGFDAIAPRYDLLNDIMTFGLHRAWKRKAVSLLRCQPGARILDLCSGTGDLARVAAQRVPQCRIAAMDFSLQMMAQGRARTQDAPIDWSGADATNLPFQNECFDGALVGFGLRNVTSIEATLRETLRVLKPGARLVNLDTAGAELGALQPLLRLHMNIMVPVLGTLLAGSHSMYKYLSTSAAGFETPQELKALFEQCGFREVGYRYCPRGVGGAALVWGEKP
ncbi:MAG: ubiquinone/menaquinone biosynthesis methyltransferase [Candidatus Hinthialibacter antarcticus]|nr:ubiquinone/menaquinone biosynthesis methyltransferase [Candidatus Hinthialibacter antarcticus]